MSATPVTLEVPACPTGIEEPVGRLYAAHHGWLQSWLHRKLGNGHDAADLAQDTFVRILAGRDAHAIEQPRAFLTTVARGVLANWCQRQALERRYLQALAQMPEASTPSPEQRLLILQTLHEVDALLDALPPTVKRAFLMSQLDGLTYDEIAARLVVSLATVKRYMKRAFLQCLTLMGLTAVQLADARTPISPQALEEAADWLVRLNAPDAGPEDRAACEHWRQRDPVHARAWARAERLLHTLGQLPPELAMPALDRPSAEGRRVALRKLALVLAVGPSAWSAWQGWRWAEGPGGPNLTAAHRTTTGERRELPLADGSVVTLNTASAIDLRFDETQRLILLRAGEILVRSHPDPQRASGLPARPLRVRTTHGLLEALGTRFTARQDDESTQVAVLEGAVRIAPGSADDAGIAQPALVLQAGQQARFTPRAASTPVPVDESIAAWQQGMLLADRMRLADFATELARYRGGWVRCDPAVAELRISGAYPVGSLNDTDRALVMLVTTYPIEAQKRVLGRWVTFAPR